MKMTVKRMISFVLALALCCTLLPQIVVETNAVSTSQYTPYANIEYGYSTNVECGTIRYMAQEPAHKDYFFEDYWPEAAFGSYSSPTKECGTASMSMALSYVGVNKTPNDLLTPKDGKTYFISWGDAEALSYKCTNFETAFEKYVNGNGKYSPPMIHLNKYSSDGHYMLIIGKIGTNTYQVLDPANQKLWEITINGSVATYNHPNGGASKKDSLDRSNTSADIYQWYNPNVSICDHHYADTSTNCGICSECGHVFDWKSTFNPADAGIYNLLNTNYVPRTEPYTNSVPAGFCVYPNSVEVIGSYTNAYGNKWYVIKNSGKEYYIYYERMKLVKHDAPKVTCTNFAPANNATIKKATYNLTGTVTSNYSLKSIEAYLDGTKYATWTASNKTTTTVNLNDTVVNKSLRFASLSTGKHTITLKAYSYNNSTAVSLLTSIFYIEDASCSHSYSSKVTTAATCTTAGVKTYTCSKCSASYTESIAATGHSWKSATCTAAKTCSTCGTTSGSALGHSYNSGVVTTVATCTTAGVKTYTCSTCGAKKTESIAVTGHSWKSATCSAAKTCSTCGATSGTALGHSYNSGVITTAATCTTAGVKTYTCSTCGAKKTESIAVTGHSWNSATCTAAKTCSTCGATSGTALGHSYNSGVITTAATCTTAGVKTYTCSTCGAKKTESIAVTGHSWKSATCSAAKTCSTCGATSGTALGHSYNSGVITTAATCTTAGVKTYTCNTCAAKKTESITATGHSWNSATCTAAKTCSTCGATSGTELEHSYKAEITLPTCTEQGYTTHTCSVCGDSYKDSTTSALGHQYSDGSCVRCGAEDPNYVANQNMPKIIVEGANAKAGETVSVTIALKNNPGITALNLAFRYDTTALTFVSAENMATDMTMTWGTAYVWDCASNYTHSGDLLKITFQIADNATSGDYSVEVIFLDASNEDFKEVQMSVESGYITVTAAIYGDANGDGKVTTVDLSMLRKYLANIDPSTGESSLGVKLGADVNGDGKVSTVDLSMLRKYFANMDPVTGESALVLGPR